MTYKSTRDIVRRVMPLLDQLATRSIDKARLLQYLSAAAGVDWGVLQVVADDRTGDERVITYRDVANGAEHSLAYPGVLPAELHDLVLAEYKRLAVDRPLSSMDERLFVHFYGHSHCDRCVYRGPGNAQIHAECFFAGHPVNFELQPPDK
ncbi:MAG TPA: hypothetical protein PKA95_17250 [Thermomicrobiales bacterium]|nr:hypothetical protein [Thermomicrobiales bacterium]